MILIAGKAFATLSVPFTVDVGAGYREDKLKMHLHLPGDDSSLVYEENYNHLQFAQTEITLRTVQRDIFLLGNFGYGGIGKGTFSQGPVVLDFSQQAPTYHFDTSADALQAYAILGYQVNLTPDRYYTVALTPLFGYAWYYEKIERKNPNPHPFFGPLFSGQPDFFTMSSSLANDLKTQWYGFFIGVDLQVFPGGRVTFNATYAYHFMALRQRVVSLFHVETFAPPNTLLSNFTIEDTMRLKAGGNHGHLGVLKAQLAFNQRWSGILYGKVLYLTSHVRDVNVKQQTTTIFPIGSTSTVENPRKYKVRYTILELLLELSYRI